MIFSDRKKIRGWKRRIRHIDDWFENNKVANLESFETRGEDYIKIRIDPWNRLCKQVPPAWYFRLIIKKLIAIHDDWKLTYDALNKPFDLQIWLYDPNNIMSEVVCASVDKKGEKRENYFRKSKDSLTFPSQKWSCYLYDLSRFTWELYDDEDFRFKNIEKLEEEDIRELMSKKYKAETTTINGQDEIMYSKKVDHVWIGRLK
jgi:hypothetical protein